MFELMKKILLVFLCFPFFVFSQDFSNEDFIYLKRHENIKIELNDHKFGISKHVSEQAEYLTSNKLYFANEVMHFDSFTSIENIDAYTYLPKTDQKVAVDYIETKREFDNGIFYSDQEAKYFTFPAVTEGAITNLNYTEVIKDPHFLGMFRFGTYVPTKSVQLSIEFSKNVTIGYVKFNTENIGLDFKKEELQDTNKYTWTVNNLKGFEGEEDSESSLYYVPHIIVYIKSYEENGKIHNVLNDTKDLYQWYASLVNQIDNTNLEQVYKIAENLTKSLKTNKEKAEAIFSWVQNNINYVAFEDGLGGFIPRSAASVYSKRYGDCKDMANLLYEMLNHVGITSYRTWIGTRDRHYTYIDVPTPMVDNHMINTVVIENDTIFLDATDSFVPFGMPSAFTQTKEALLGIDESTYKIIKVPAQKPEQSITTITSQMSLDGETLKVSQVRNLIGYDKVDFISEYLFKKQDKTDEEFLNTTLALGNNKTKYTNISKENFDNKNTPLILKYDLDIENYIKNIGDKSYINMNIDRTLSKSNIDIKERKYSKKIDYKFKKEFTTRFSVPKGYTTNYVPETLSFDHPNYGYSIAYTTVGDQIIQHKSIYINTLSIKNDEFESWNEFITSIIKAYKKSIIIEKLP